MSGTKTENEKEKKNILVLCVDRDDDLEEKTDFKTPLIGREKNLKAAEELALHDPEEADANAMFGAIRVYDTLKAEEPEEKFEISTITGSKSGGVKADRKIVKELNDLLKIFPAREVILVTDGYSDEEILPLIESKIPVSSVRRIVVKHSEAIEETAAIISRYLKMILENPRYSRIFLGLPGLLLFILGIFTIFDLLYYYWIAFTFVLSLFMLVKGFGADSIVKNFIKWIKDYSPPPLRVQITNYAIVAGVLCIIIGSYLGGTSATTIMAETSTPINMAEWFKFLPTITGLFIKDSATLIIVGIGIALLGRAIRWYLERDIRLLRNSALIVSIGWSRQILNGTSEILIDPTINPEKLILPIAVGILIAIASIMVIVLVHRTKKDFFKKSGEDKENEEENEQTI